MAAEAKTFDIASFFSKVEVELILPDGEHSATFINWTPANAGINLNYQVNGINYKSYQTQNMLNITLKDMERQANTGLANPIAFLQAIEGCIFTIHAATTVKGGKTYHNVNWRPLPATPDPETDQEESETEDLK